MPGICLTILLLLLSRLRLERDLFDLSCEAAKTLEAAKLSAGLRQHHEALLRTHDIELVKGLGPVSPHTRTGNKTANHQTLPQHQASARHHGEGAAANRGQRGFKLQGTSARRGCRHRRVAVVAVAAAAGLVVVSGVLVC